MIKPLGMIVVLWAKIGCGVGVALGTEGEAVGNAVADGDGTGEAS